MVVNAELQDVRQDKDVFKDNAKPLTVDNSSASQWTETRRLSVSKSVRKLTALEDARVIISTTDIVTKL